MNPALKSKAEARYEVRRKRGRTAAQGLRSLPLSQVHRLIEPGPVVLLTTAKNGAANVMTMSWRMMIEFEPPLIACVVSSSDYSFAALRETGQCVIAVPARKLARKVVAVGNASGRDIDKFAAFGLTARPAKKVGAPLIAECFANLECEIADRRLVKDYDLFILKVVKAWIDPNQPKPKTIHHHGRGVLVIDGEEIRLNSKMR